VRARARHEKPGLVRADTLEVVIPAAERVPAPCPYFGRCGGCHYQHAPYEYQLGAKQRILVEELRRLGKIEPPGEITTISGEPWGYRNRAQLHVDGDRMGYREARSHRLCAIDHCPISSPKLNEAIAALVRMQRDPRWPRFVRSLEVFTDETQVQINVLDTDRPVARRFFDWCAEEISGVVPGPLDYQGRFRVSSNSFFQVNRFLADRLVEAAMGAAEGETAFDLYAGVGLFSLPLARRFKKLVAVESGGGAVRDLQFNAERAGLTNVKTEQRATEEFLAGVRHAADFILLDPPRAGIGKAVVERLAALRPRRLTIVACDPATLARDLAGLVAAGFRLDKVTLVDLFPQTFHMETVVELSA
jgi:23S rRNA (uracil1939-C5)-methyltransferase